MTTPHGCDAASWLLTSHEHSRATIASHLARIHCHERAHFAAPQRRPHGLP
jgi:hypothetical protein